MDSRSNAEFWYDFMGDSDDDNDVFQGFTDLDLVKVDPANAESDLDIDFDAFAQDSDSNNSDLSDEEGSNVDMLPPLPRQDWGTTLSEVTSSDYKNESGVCHSLPVGAEPLDYFQLFFSDTTFKLIADETNKYATQMQTEKGVVDSKWRPTTTEEVKVYFAINIMMGIHVLPRVQCYWSSDDTLNVPCISGLMSRTRFEKIGQYLHLNDRTEYIPRGQPGFDPLFKVRPIITIMQKQCSDLYKPGQAISIDEAMIKFNGRLFFKQYMKSKPTPWGVKVWCSADPDTGYLLDFDVYTGKSQTVMKGMYSRIFYLQVSINNHNYSH